MSDPLWYKDAILYEVHVRAFFDSSGDGMGDFAGLTQKLDYLQEFGVTAIWVLPFNPSPWRDDGYDIADYTGVHPAYGTLRDFQTFLKEAHRRGLRVITELVLNHTSDQHPWFQRSRRAAPGSVWRNFYVWSDIAEKYREARIIFQDFESSNWSWDPVAKAYYWHRFYSHQPDLNYDSPEVRTAVMKAMEFWLEMGVDGFRLDAVPYLFEREGTNCENLPETHAFLKELRHHIDQKYPNRMILAEANQWPEDAIAYFGDGDECHMAFHFPLMPRLFMAMRMEDSYPITEILQLTPSIPETCQWALFLRNHDELTLEMVTDEERDYMYRVYAQDRKMRVNLGIRRRLAPLLGHDRRRIELMNSLLFSLPGTPVIYYGDEIGMGDNFYLGDRNGVRTPMQWSADRNAGFSRANPQRLYLPVIIDPEYHYEALNVEAQQANPHSLLWWMRRLIEQRKGSKALSRGTLEFLQPDNRRVLAFVREYDGERVLVLANLSRFAQSAGIPLGKYRGLMPVEMFGRTEFPPIAEHPYFLSLGPHAFYWFHLQPRSDVDENLLAGPGEQAWPTLRVRSWQEVFSPEVQSSLLALIPSFLRKRRWYLGMARGLRQVDLSDVMTIPDNSAHLLILRVQYKQGEPDIYTLPLSVAHGAQAENVVNHCPEFILARLEHSDGSWGVLYSALQDPEFGIGLLNAIARRKKIRGEEGEIAAAHTRAFREIWGADRPRLEAASVRGEYNHSSITFGDRFFLKIFRKLDQGINPELEVERFLNLYTSFNAAPRIAGWLEYRTPNEEPWVFGILQNRVPSDGTGWQYTMNHLSLFFERALAGPYDAVTLPTTDPYPLSLRIDSPPPVVSELLGDYVTMVGLLGKRTAEMHLALASRPDIPDFAPEPFTDFYRQSLYHGMLALSMRTFGLLRDNLASLPEEVRVEAASLLNREKDVRAHFQSIRDRRLNVTRIRHHGDFHLGQVLHTGKDFVIIDFEGDPNQPVGQRRIKRSPLRDVASMLRSVHYVAHSALFGQIPGVIPRRESYDVLRSWAEFWSRWANALFLSGYLEMAGKSPIIPESIEELRILMQAYLLERALVELRHELGSRPDWVRIPVHGLLEILGS
ncbi:MAG: maltose alpha-D-glucosyltransferase [Bryobacteraceae bacterium]